MAGIRRNWRINPTFESADFQRFLANLDVLGVAGVFAKVVGELDHLFPSAFFGDLGCSEVHHDVHCLHVVDIAGEEGADTKRVLHSAIDGLMDGDGLIHIQAVAENDG